MEEDEDDEAMF